MSRLIPLLALVSFLPLTLPACDDQDAQEHITALAIEVQSLQARNDELEAELADERARGIQLALPADLDDTDGPSFRLDDYKAGYITKLKSDKDVAPVAIDFERFAWAFLLCKLQEPSLQWTMTLTRYTPDSTKRARVVGFGGSTLSEGPAIDCWEKLWSANGEILLP